MFSSYSLCTVDSRSETPCALNATQSNTWSLPSELLSVIFQYACLTCDFFVEESIQIPPFHLALRLVSTLWCDIVQSTPQLWASVFLPKLRAKNVDVKGRYLKLCLDNSGSLPLTLYLRFHRELRGCDRFISPEVDAALEHSVHRIQALRLLQPPRIWMEKLLPKMCFLTMIHINSRQPRPPWPSHSHDERLFLPKTERLNRIYISSPCLLDYRFECTTSFVTHVELHALPIDFAVQILLRCPNLVDFCCLHPVAALKVKNPRSMLASPLVLSHVSTFSWSTYQYFESLSEWDIMLSEYIHFTALTRFNWWPGFYFVTNRNTSATVALLSGFPKSVTTFELSNIGRYFEPGIQDPDYFLLLTDVTQLRLCHCNHQFVEDVFSRGSDRSSVIFPKLTSMIIKYEANERKTPPFLVFRPQSGEKLAQMLQSRIGLIEEFKVIVEMADLTRCWSDEVWKTLRELKRDGLNLTLIEHGQTLI